jgi:polyisoprenyl-phosphate glycosyltransferase
MKTRPADADMPARAGKVLLSVVIPVFNEEQVIDHTHRRLIEELGASDDFDIEIIYVNDGSSDRTGEILRLIGQQEPRVCLAFLSRNFGQQPAITAGLRQASGDVVAIIDADLQDPIELIPPMVEKWREGFDVVYGIRRNRKESIPKVFAYSLFYRVLARLADIDLPRDSGDFCVIDRRVIDAINRLPEQNRFVRGLRAWYGGRQFGMPYDRPTRNAGKPGYSYRKLVNLAFDGIFNFSVVPLRMIFWLGLTISAFSLFALVFFLAHRIFQFEIFGRTPADVPGFTSIILAVLFLSGVQILSLGVVGEYLARVYLEVKNRPAYVVSHLRPSRFLAERRLSVIS